MNSRKLASLPRPHFSVQERLDRVKRIRVALIAVSEWGHVVPISNLAKELQDRGHDVHIIISSYNGENIAKMLRENSKIENVIVTDDKISKSDMRMDEPIDRYGQYLKGWSKWKGILKEELRRLDPDLVVSDFYSVSGQFAADELNIPCIINIPGLV